MLLALIVCTKNNEKTEAHGNATSSDKKQRVKLDLDESGQDTKGKLFVVGYRSGKNSEEFWRHAEKSGILIAL